MIVATPAHAAAMAAIHAAAFPAGERWDAVAFAAQLALPGCFGLIDPAGGVVLARAAAEEAEVLTLGVALEARRRGIGRRLLATTAAIAAERGARVLFLEVARSNQAALALYESVGLVQVGLRPRYYPGGDDALVLRTTLSSD